MERTFLKIARYALVVVIALALLVTVLSAAYGGMQFWPASQSRDTKISIALKDVMPHKEAEARSSAASPNRSEIGADAAVSGKCLSISSGLNRLSAQIGWDTKEQQAYNPDTLAVDTKTVVEYGSTLNTQKFCSFTGKFIKEQNEKLAPYIKGINLTDSYYDSLQAVLTETLQNADSVRSLPTGDPNKYYFVSFITAFNDKYAKSIDDLRDAAIQRESDYAAAKVKGAAFLYIAGSAFAFFFACCLILVFIRIEVNTRELVEAVRASQGQLTSIPLSAPDETVSV
ncbi:hypothetical protein P8935_24000 [Telmatobacter sp. DSM 110680]|uniref:Uncharacterized protein n=1 Tax=Telmatobacter sp. DSM 110680 TaxID=3036704 RepID=A0AAU7DHQ3_9BACT